MSTILDAFTRRVLAYVLSDSLEVVFVLETVNGLLEQHRIYLYYNNDRYQWQLTRLFLNEYYKSEYRGLLILSGQKRFPPCTGLDS